MFDFGAFGITLLTCTVGLGALIFLTWLLAKVANRFDLNEKAAMFIITAFFVLIMSLLAGFGAFNA